MTQRSPFLAAGLTALALALTAAGARAQPAGQPDLPPGHPPVAAGATVKMQGNDEAAWIADAHVHAFYDLTVATFAGAARPDVDAYEQKAFAIFRAFGSAHGMDPAMMQDHLKLIPRQVAQIVREDPKVLASYDNFVAATFGPQ